MFGGIQIVCGERSGKCLGMSSKGVNVPILMHAMHDSTKVYMQWFVICDTLVNTQTDTQTGRQTDRQTDRQTELLNNGTTVTKPDMT